MHVCINIHVHNPLLLEEVFLDDHHDDKDDNGNNGVNIVDSTMMIHIFTQSACKHVPIYIHNVYNIYNNTMCTAHTHTHPHTHTHIHTHYTCTLHIHITYYTYTLHIHIMGYQHKLLKLPFRSLHSTPAQCPLGNHLIGWFHSVETQIHICIQNIHLQNIHIQNIHIQNIHIQNIHIQNINIQTTHIQIHKYTNIYKCLYLCTLFNLWTTSFHFSAMLF